jgi:xanthine/CO dehydrogenase XdhC/CoxF family maturation factor
MTELQSILAALDVPSVLATVVNVEGSAYRQPGARMLVLRDGQSIGTISGGCLEADVIERGWELTSQGRPALIGYDTRGEDSGENSGGNSGEDLLADWGFGMGCNGAVDVLVERIDPTAVPEYLRLLEQALEHRKTIVLATVFARCGDVPVEVGTRLVLDSESRPGSPLALFEAGWDTLRSGRSQVVTVEFAGDFAGDFAEGSARVFCEIIAPPPHLLICGAGHDAMPLVNLAAETGWMVSVCDRRAALATGERFPRAAGVYAVPAEESIAVLSHAPDAAVVMTHRYPEDVKLLRMLADSPVRYIGVLGPRHRTDRLLKAAEIEPTVELAQRLHAPIGLDLGAETPEQIALAILAEATAVLHGYAGGKLRDKGGAIHLESSKLKIKNSKLEEKDSES